MADPTRLRIVDHLAFGDASSTELATLLEVPSNLLAHHLGVLEREDSSPATAPKPTAAAPTFGCFPAPWTASSRTGVTPVPRVVFVCTANSARSQLAAALWSRASPVPATSAGTHPASAIAPGAARTASDHRLPLIQSPPQPLPDLTGRGLSRVTVCDNAYEDLDPTAPPGTHSSVPDPVRSAAQPLRRRLRRPGHPGPPPLAERLTSAAT